jgi:hypothetical protein
MVPAATMAIATVQPVDVDLECMVVSASTCYQKLPRNTADSPSEFLGACRL